MNKLDTAIKKRAEADTICTKLAPQLLKDHGSQKHEQAVKTYKHYDKIYAECEAQIHELSWGFNKVVYEVSPIPWEICET